MMQVVIPIYAHQQMTFGDMTFTTYKPGSGLEASPCTYVRCIVRKTVQSLLFRARADVALTCAFLKFSSAFFSLAFTVLLWYLHTVLDFFELMLAWPRSATVYVRKYSILVK